jgi:hypothetical protein
VREHKFVIHRRRGRKLARLDGRFYGAVASSGSAATVGKAAAAAVASPGSAAAVGKATARRGA